MTTRTKITQKQMVILDYIRRYIDNHGVSPKLTEIVRQFNFGGTGQVSQKLDCLEARGLIHRIPGCHRNIRIGPETLERDNSVRTQ